MLIVKKVEYGKLHCDRKWKSIYFQSNKFSFIINLANSLFQFKCILCKIVCYCRYPIVVICKSNDSDFILCIFLLCVCVLSIVLSLLLYLSLLFLVSDLSDLVEIIHKVVKLMDNLQSRGALRVS